MIDAKSPVGEMIHTMDSDELASLFLTSRVKLLHNQQEINVSKSFERDTELGTGKVKTLIVNCEGPI